MVDVLDPFAPATTVRQVAAASPNATRFLTFDHGHFLIGDHPECDTGRRGQQGKLAHVQVAKHKNGGASSFNWFEHVVVCFCLGIATDVVVLNSRKPGYHQQE